MPTWFANLLLIALVACNGSLGLDDVIVDNDGDNLRDTADNCADIANADQEDWDNNGVGDACDTCDAPLGVDSDEDGIDDGCDGCVGPGRIGVIAPNGVDNGCQVCQDASGEDFDRDGIDDTCDKCPRGDDHDEDGDGVADACDACPTRSDPLQLMNNMDGDRLGDACDPDIDPLDVTSPPAADQSTRVFDPFVADRDAWWEAGDWTYANGQAQIPAGSSRRLTYPLGLRHLIETVVTIPPGSGTSFSINLLWRECPSFGCDDSQTSCSIFNNGLLQLASYDGLATEKSGVDLSGPVRLWFRSRTSTDKNFRDQICVAIDKNGVVTRVTRLGMAQGGLGLAHEVSILSSTAATLDYVWFVSN